MSHYHIAAAGLSPRAPNFGVKKERKSMNALEATHLIPSACVIKPSNTQQQLAPFLPIFPNQRRVATRHERWAHMAMGTKKLS